MSSQVRILFSPQGNFKSEISNLKLVSGSSSVGRAIAFQAIGREFEPRFPLSSLFVERYSLFAVRIAKDKQPATALKAVVAQW